MSTRSSWIKWVGGAVVAVILGAVGSGVWQGLMGPGLSWLVRLGLNIGTLGVDKFKDGVYQEMATGNVQAASVVGLHAVMLGVSFLVGFLSGVQSFVLARRRVKARGAVKRAAGEGISNLAPLELDKAPSAMLWASLPFLLGLVVFLLIGAVRVEYIADTQAHFGQCERLLAPAVSGDTRVMWEAQFAGMRRRADFIGLEGRLEAAAREHGITLPKYEAW